MIDLLSWKKLKLSEPTIFGDDKDLREVLANFYANYPDQSTNLDNVVGMIEMLVRLLKLPIPLVFFDLLRQSEHDPDPSIYNDWQRDHVLHSLNLFTLGALLISLRKTVEDSLGPGSLETRLKQFAFCALCHDIGYAHALEDVRAKLIDKVLQEVQTRAFILVCAYGHRAPETANLARVDQRNDLVKVVKPAQEFIRAKLGTTSSGASSGGAVVAATSGFARYLGLSGRADHAVSSAVLLRLCREIGEAIASQPDALFDGCGVTRPSPTLWAGLDDPRAAIERHGDQAHMVPTGASLANPWIPFLHLMDELAAYDRVPLHPGSIRTPLPMTRIGVEDTDDEWTIGFPMDNPKPFTGITALRGIARSFGLRIARKKKPV